MEINITAFVRDANPHDFSASAMEMGDNAGKITWDNAVQEAATTQLIDQSGREAFEAWARDFGAWERDEINAWSLDECNALLIQYISGDLKSLESLCYSDEDEFGIDWTKAEELSQQGTIGGNIFKGTDGEVYFYMDL